MLLLCLTLAILFVLPNIGGDLVDLELNAILEATRQVDGYRQLAATGMRQQTIAGTIINGKRPHTSYTAAYLFTRHGSPPEMTDGLTRSARIANLATKIILSRGGIINPKSFQAKMGPVCAVPKIKCNPLFRYRSIDGSCNNVNFPLMGKSLTAQPRFLPACYGDKLKLGFSPRVDSKVGGPLPNPRFISNMFNREGSSRIYRHGPTGPNSPIFNVALTSFGQTVSHDMSSIPTIRGYPDIECCKGNKPVHRPECFSFQVPLGEFKSTCMSFVRTEIGPKKYCAPGVRNQLNQATSYLDLSIVYGSTTEETQQLVDWKSGTFITGPGNMLALDVPQSCMGPAGCFKGGDTRHSVIPDLTVFHTLFHREHNRIVKLLCKLNPHWNGDRLFHEARKILIGVYQHIVYNEYIPAVIGKNIMKMYAILPTLKGYNTMYDQTVDASVRNSFAVGPLRFGHGQIRNDIGCAFMNRKLKMKLPLQNEYFNTRLLRNPEVGSSGMMRWMTTEYSYQASRVYSDAMRNMLFQTKPGDGFDLAALDIQRGRDHGIPAYNKFRKFCGLKPALMFKAGVFGLPDHDQESAMILSKTYKHVDDIDLITGGISEMHINGGIVGPTFACMIGLQFQLSKVGDRFFYENDFKPTGFNPVQLSVIKRQSMSALLCRNFKMEVMQPAAFVSYLSGQQALPCGKFPHLGPKELSAWQEVPLKL